MPFAKWTLEPVFVSKTLPWASLKPPQPLSTLANDHPATSDKSSSNLNEPKVLASSQLPPPTMLLGKYLHEDLVLSSIKGKSMKKKINGDIKDAVVNGGKNGENDVLMMNEHDLMKDDHQSSSEEKDPNDEYEDGQQQRQSDNIIHEDQKNTIANAKKSLTVITTSSAVNNDKKMLMMTADSSTSSISNLVLNGCYGSSFDLKDDEQVLLKIHNRTLVGIIRQMASLLSTSDQMFTELTEECRRMLDRSVRLRSRFIKLTSDIDRLNHQMRHSAPRIGKILDYQDQPPKEQHWKSPKPLDRSLFTMETRPLSVRNSYARAHAPGDVRLSCSIFSPFGPFGGHHYRPTTKVTSQQQSNIPLKINIETSSCQCHCGRCHRSPMNSTITNNNQQQQLTANRIINNQSTTQTKMVVESEYETSRSCECCENDGISPNESSSSSIVTWSSVTSSTFEPVTSNHAHVHHHPHHNQQQQHRSTTASGKLVHKAKVEPMSSFSSSGDYYPNGPSITKNNINTTTPKTIDDFFRKNNVADRSEKASSICTCSCIDTNNSKTFEIMTIKDQLPSMKNDDSSCSQMVNNSGQEKQAQNSNIALSPQTSSSATINQIPTAAIMGTSPDHWYWWWWMENDENRRRWSSALTGSSPLKPTMLDEITIWLRENIETRRPESIVFKSASELPQDVLLEHALSPPCSSHKITLRNQTKLDYKMPREGISLSDDPDSIQQQTYPRLKRRWSLFPLRRLSRRFGFKNRFSLAFDGDSSAANDDYYERSKDNQNDNCQIISSSPIYSSYQNIKNDDEPKEIVLMLPEERAKLIADQYADSTMVSIDVSGRNFERLSNMRRSLIHSDFHIPRNKVPGLHYRRSRSKSPHVSSTRPKTNIDTVSPYALGHLNINNEQNDANQKTRRIVIEKGCQTDDHLDGLNMINSNGDGTNNSNNRFVVPIEVHHNHDDISEFDRQHFYKHNLHQPIEYNDEDEDDDEYVVILKKQQILNHNHHQHHFNHKRRTTKMDDTTSSNASIEMSWRRPVTQNDKIACSLPPQTTKPSMKNSNNLSIMATNATVNNYQNTNSQIIRHRIHQYSINSQKKGKQNGARSSSGNWSAATSDLVHSSSSSSSPPLQMSNGHSRNCDGNDSGTVNSITNNNDSIQRQHNSNQLQLTNQTGEIAISNANNNNKEQGVANTNASHNEEAESVYSVDNDGYYTSMHTDSGLFFGSNSLPLSHHHHHPVDIGLSTNNRMTNTTSTFTSQTSLTKRQQQQQKKKKINPVDVTYRSTLMAQRWKRFNITMNHHLQINSTIGNNNKPKTSLDILDIKSIDNKDDGNEKESGVLHSNENSTKSNENNDRRTMDGSNQLSQQQSQQYGSNLSINSILSNSDAATANTSTAAMDHVSFDTCNSSMADFDCSVSHCSHQMTSSLNHHQNQHVDQKGARHDGGNQRSRKGRIRTASGTYQDDDAGTIRSSSSSETLHTNDYDEEVPQEDISDHHLHHCHQKHHRHSEHSVMSKCRSSSTVNNNNHQQRKIQRYASLTESSSNSSSCRKLPPPPPPPRVSSMLRTLQKYSIKRGDISHHLDDQNTLSSCNSTSEQTTATMMSQQTMDTTNGGGTGNGDTSIASQLSETNSEYLLHSIHDERRRRLFLDVDSNRSYPPLSYIVYDQMTDTATSVSIPSSTCFDEEVHEHSEDNVDNAILSTTKHHRLATTNSKSITAITSGTSSRTITPVPSELGDNNNSDDGNNGNNHLSSSVINLDNNGKKQLEERHLSSPLPPPKLDSFTLNHHHHSPTKLRTKSSSSCNDSQKLSSTSSLTSSSTVKASSSPETIPKPKPRNSLILSTTGNNSTFSTTTCSNISNNDNLKFNGSESFSSSEYTNKTFSKDKEDENEIKSSNITTPTLSSSNKQQSANNSSRRLTTEDLFIILHNSKKRHNIRADPPLFPVSQRLSSPNSQSSTSSGPRSPLSSDETRKSSSSSKSTAFINSGKTSPTKSLNNENFVSMKRRSWTGTDMSKNINNGSTARTRQSLVLDRLGPVRPTTLNDFKRLLAQVRLSPTTTSCNISSHHNNGSPISSTYSALQQVLKSNSGNNYGNIQHRTQSPSSQAQSPSSGVSSLSSVSPICSPLSPNKSITTTTTTTTTTMNTNNGNSSPMTTHPPISPETSYKPTINKNSPISSNHPTATINSNQSMSNFIKKFSKSKFLSQVYSNPDRISSVAGGISGYRSPTIARLDVCPPIPEDDSVCTTTSTTSYEHTTNNNKQKQQSSLQKLDEDITNNSDSGSFKHNCTSTWV